ncbi:MAG: EAL domain-containing protein [Gammaproteobacteria bacterium]
MPSKTLFAALLGLMFCISPVAVSMAATPMVFSHLAVEDGLSQNTVLTVFQDSKGFMWIGTEAGLNRFDGYQFKRYNQDRSNPDALRSDFIWDIDEDLDGNLWFATKGGGLVRWERAADRFVTYRNDPNNARSLSSDAVRSVLVDADGHVWAGTRGGGLNRFRPETDDFDNFRHNPHDARSISDDTIFDLMMDRQGNLWLGTNAGLNVMDVQAERFLNYRHQPGDDSSLSNDIVMRVYQDASDTIWVGTFEGGLNRFDSLTDRFTSLRHVADDPSSLSHDYVWSILEDANGRLWVGTQDGLNLLDRTADTFTRYQKSSADPTSLGASYVMSLFQDARGLMWIGTRGAGISQWNPRSWSLGHYKNDQLKDAMVVAFASDNTDGVWIAALGAGLSRLDRKTGEFKPLQDFLQPGQALSDPRAMSLLIDRNNAMWVGTMTGGLNRIDLENGTVRTWKNDPNDPASLSANGVMSLLEYNNGDIWVGTFGGGLNRYLAETDRFERFNHDPKNVATLSSPRATALAQDPQGRIWIGTDDAGLNLLDPATRRVWRFNHDPGDQTSLSSNGIYTLHVDAAGTIWVGTTDGGLNRIDGGSSSPQDVRFEHIDTNAGLSSNVVYGMQSDADGHLWLSGNLGLTRYNPISGVTQNYHKRHGLQGEEFNFGAHHRDANGRLYFGGANGFNAFYPRDLEQLIDAPPVVLTSFEKFNKPFALDMPYSQVAGVRLGYDDDVVTFEFAALDYVAPDKNRYRYMLEGFDQDWVESGNRRRVTYTNLGAGNYVFRVRAADSSGTWFDDGLVINVRVDAAPWATPVAYLLYVSAALLVIGGVFAWQHRRLKAAAQLRQLAYYDTLTGLPNIKLFRQRLTDTLAEASRENEEVAVLYVDLDRFKRINDTLGHTVGDHLIKSVAGRLSQCVHGRSDAVNRFDLARISGDEFLIFARHGQARREAREMAEDIAQVLSQSYSSGGQELVVSASIGGAVFPDHGEDAESLIKAADMAVALAKQDGRRSFRLYSRNLSARAVQRLSLEHEIRIALEENQFQLYYQPKYRTGDLKIVGAEGLLRWFHPTRGEISPGQFISVAEEAGQISDLSRWVVGAACAQLRTWQDQDLPLVPVAVNLSPEDFLRDNPVQMILDATSKSDISPHYLNIEITESALMRDIDRVSASLHEIKALGCELSVDDFGTGYSSLAYLKRFPLDTLKIDRSFVSDISTDADDAAICSAIVAMGRVLGLKVVAEGVETEDQLRRLRADACDQFQGFLLSKAVPADLFMDQLLTQSPAAGKAQKEARETEKKIVQLVQR